MRSHAKSSRAHVKDPVVHVRVWWILETIRKTTCTAGSVAAGFPQGEPPKFAKEEIPMGK